MLLSLYRTLLSVELVFKYFNTFQRAIFIAKGNKNSTWKRVELIVNAQPKVLKI